MGNMNIKQLEKEIESLGIDPENLPKKIRANFYKCGDKTAHPHYVSWAPINTPQPDFHRRLKK